MKGPSNSAPTASVAVAHGNGRRKTYHFISLFDCHKPDLNAGFLFWGHQPPLGLSLPWGSPKAEPCFE